MSEKLEQSADEQEPITMELFCARLRVAREDKKFTIDSVAAELRLKSELIEALENNDTVNLPSKMFVMGYLRSYARLVGIDGSDLDKLDLSSVRQSGGVKSTLSGPPEKNSKHLSVRLVTYLVAIGLLSLLAVWWISMQSDIAEIAVVDEYQQHEQPNEKSSSLPTAESGETEQAVVAEVVPEPPPILDDSAGTVEKGPGDSVENGPGDSMEDASVIATVEPAAVVTADTVTADAVTADTVVVEEDEKPVAMSDLKITYLKDSWTEISDATGKRLLFGLYKQGNEEVVQGVAPFTLFFGFAPGVVITHNEEQFDHTEFHRKGMARFKVGTADDNHLPATN